MTSALLDALNAQIHELLAQELAPLRKELAFVKSMLPEWVSQKEAARITGKCADTLKAEVGRKSTLIVVKYEGPQQKSPKYLLGSLIAYNDSKIVRRITGHSLTPSLSK